MSADPVAGYAIVANTTNSSLNLLNKFIYDPKTLTITNVGSGLALEIKEAGKSNLL